MRKKRQRKKIEDDNGEERSESEARWELGTGKAVSGKARESKENKGLKESAR